MRRGPQKEVIPPGTDERVAIYGVLDSRTGHAGYARYSQKGLKNFMTFLETLCTQVKTGPILVILDDDGPHKAKAVQEWPKENPPVHLLWLPKCAPYLNPVETVWRILKARLAGYRFMDTGDLIWATEQHLRHKRGVQFGLPIAV